MRGAAWGCRRALSSGRGEEPPGHPVPSRAGAHDGALIQKLGQLMTMLPSLKRGYDLRVNDPLRRRSFPLGGTLEWQVCRQQLEGTLGDLGTLVEAGQDQKEADGSAARLQPLPPISRAGWARRPASWPAPCSWDVKAICMCASRPTLTPVCTCWTEWGVSWGHLTSFPCLPGLSKPWLGQAALGLEGAPGSHPRSLNNQLSLLCPSDSSHLSGLAFQKFPWSATLP